MLKLNLKMQKSKKRLGNYKPPQNKKASQSSLSE